MARRPAQLAPILAVAAALTLTACTRSPNQANTTTTASSPANRAAARLLAQAMSAARSAGSAHIDNLVHQGGKVGTFVNDSASTSGRQVVTVGSAVTTLEVVDNTGYVQANSAGLTQFLNFPASFVSRLENRWIEVKSTQSAYASVFGSVTLSGALRELTPSNPITETGTTVIDGHPVIGLRGPIHGGSATIYVSAAGTPYPVEVVASAGSSNATATLGNWGEPVQVTRPPNPIPVTSIH